MSVSTSFKKFLHKIKLIALLLILIAILFFGFYFLDKFLSIKNIVITGTTNKIIGLEELKNLNTFFLNTEESADNIVRKNPAIKSIVIEKKLPNTLIVKVIENKLLASLIVSNGYFYLSEEGRIIFKAKSNLEKIPTITFYQKLNFQQHNAGDHITYKDIQYGLFFIKSLTDLGFKVESLEINGVNMLLFNLKDKKIIFSSDKDKELQLYLLDEIVRQFKIEGKNYKEIDLRYDKPIVRF